MPNTMSLISLATSRVLSGAAISGFQYDSTSGVPAAATATNLGSLANLPQYSIVLSGGTSAALTNLATSSTTGAILASGGSSANPAYGLTNAVISAGALSLGASGTLGSIALGNATSGVLTVETATGAITSYTIQLPVAQPSGSNTFLSCTAASTAVCTWAAGGGGSGTVTHTGGALTAGYAVIGNGSADTKPSTDLDDDQTTANTLTYTGTGGIVATAGPVTSGTASCTYGTAGAVCLGTGTAPTAASSYDQIWADTTSGNLLANLGTALELAYVDTVGVTTQTTTYAAATTDNVVICNSTTAFTVTLPTTSIPTGKVYRIKNKNTGTCTASAAAGIDGGTTVALGRYSSATIIWDGAQYWTF